MSVANITETRVQNRLLNVARDTYLERNRVRDQVFNHSPLGAALLGRNLGDFGVAAQQRSGLTVQGGTQIRVRLNLGANQTVKRSASHWSTSDTTPSDTRREGLEVWRFYDGTIVISDHERRVNRGPEALGNLVGEETENVLNSLVQLVIQDLYATATAPNGINSLIADIIGEGNNAGAATLHQIARGTFPAFTSRGLDGRTVSQSAGRDFTSGSFAAQGLADLTLLINNSTEGAKKPNAGFTDWASFGYLHNALQAQERFTTMDGSGGFTSLAWMGVAQFPDSECPSGHWLVMNFDEVDVVFLAGSEFTMDDFERPNNQKAATSIVHATCNAVSGGPKYLNRMSGVTA